MQWRKAAHQRLPRHSGVAQCHIGQVYCSVQMSIQRQFYNYIFGHRYFSSKHNIIFKSFLYFLFQVDLQTSTVVLVVDIFVNKTLQAEKIFKTLTFSNAYAQNKLHHTSCVHPPSPYNLPVGGYNPTLSSSSPESLFQLEQIPITNTIHLVLEDADPCKQFDILETTTKAGRRSHEPRKSVTTTAIITCDEAKRGQHKIRAWIDPLRAPPGGCPEDMT
ncbi:uncharacterized protein [Dysidea avara]|uniref:uncharacterized protein n=1 Tax=Dysidea avara TaxID=196820 RepID=UPI00331F8DC1